MESTDEASLARVTHLTGKKKANLDRPMSDHACVFIKGGLSPLPNSLLITKGLTGKAKSNHIIIRYPSRTSNYQNAQSIR